MYLSRLELDVRKRSTMKALTNPSLLHGAVECGCSGERKRRLWRVDQVNGHQYLLVLSPEKPDFTQAVKQFGIEHQENPWETKSYLPLLERIEHGSVWRFRLIANPTKSCKSSQDSTQRGQVHAHITPYYQKQWLLDRCKTYGFSLDEDAVTVVGSQWKRFYKGNQRKYPITLLAVTYEGVLTVTDVPCFRQTLQNGLGRGKAYGLGLLTVIHP